MLPLQCRLNTKRFPDSVKLIEYLASAVIVALSKPYVNPSPRTEIFFFLLSISTEELSSTPKIITFFPLISSVHENRKRVSNPML